MSKGIVVDHNQTGVRYAISEHNFDKQVHNKIRDLRPDESVFSYKPRRKGSPAGSTDISGPTTDAGELEDDSTTSTETPATTQNHHPSEGASSGVSKGTNK